MIARIQEHRHKLIHIGKQGIAYSFPEFLPERFCGNGQDIRRDYNVGYFDYCFWYDSEKDRVGYYFNNRGLMISFEEFFDHCCMETKEYILFNLDFFNPSV